MENGFQIFDEMYQQWQPEIQQYFNQLPPHIQETIRQSGIDIQSLEHLKDIAEHYEEEN